ncbi:MAG: helix-turn-helix transcriptional regulator [Thalassobaculaceae bacterium]|nr:helix-turn-helix transcriptional regulator [Thalassobaculaceae bacterium]
MENISYVLDPTDPAAQPVGRLLRKARERQKVTQTEIALIAGLSQRAVSEIETGRVEPHVATVLRILAALGGRMIIEVPDDDG